MIYLDYNATTPTEKRVIQKMMRYFDDDYGNPASDHLKGLKAKGAVEQARSNIAKLIGAKPDEIIFTSGATEANNLAIIGLAIRERPLKDHIVTSRIEHPAILEPLKYLESIGFKVSYISVDSNGVINLEELEKSITDKTFLISVMAANNEIGTIQPIDEIGKIARQQNIYFHTDAAQAVGHIPLDVDKSNVDLMSVSAHKFYGPKGVGYLFLRNRIPRVKLSPIIFGGGQERGLRSGTLNVPGIIGMAEACNIASKEMETDNKRFRTLTDTIYTKLKRVRNDIRINGHPDKRLAHTLNIEIPGIDNKWLLLKLKNYCISTGSACSHLHDEPSHVLLSIGLDKNRINNSIRIGVGKYSTESEIDEFALTLIQCISPESILIGGANDRL